MSLPQTPATAKTRTKALRPVSLSAFVAPNSRFDRLEDDDRLASSGRNRHQSHQDEEKNNSFTGGLLISYGLTPLLSLQSSITVTAATSSIVPKTVYAKADNNGRTRYELPCSSGFVYLSPEGGVQPLAGNSTKTSGTRSRLLYVGLPLALRYEISIGRFSLIPTIGTGLNLLLSEKTTTVLANGAGKAKTTTAISGLKSSFVDGQIGLGFEYSLSRKLSLGLRPNARLALTPINRETPVKSYQNFLSVETGIRIK